MSGQSRGGAELTVGQVIFVWLITSCSGATAGSGEDPVVECASKTYITQESYASMSLCSTMSPVCQGNQYETLQQASCGMRHKRTQIPSRLGGVEASTVKERDSLRKMKAMQAWRRISSRVLVLLCRQGLARAGC